MFVLWMGYPSAAIRRCLFSESLFAGTVFMTRDLMIVVIAL